MPPMALSHHGRLSRQCGDKPGGRHTAVVEQAWQADSVEPGRVTGFLGPNGAGKPDTGL
jgi:ABC-type Na+ transport system ATPase subunit NatA